MKIGLLFMAAAAAATNSPQQFDLTCTGTTKTIALGDTHEDPFRTTYHVDLAKNKWCQDSCGALYDFFAVQPATLQFKASPEHEAGDLRTNEDEAYVNRETGEYSAIAVSGRGINRMLWTTEGTCEKQAFSGFPTLKGKF